MLHSSDILWANDISTCWLGDAYFSVWVLQKKAPPYTWAEILYLSQSYMFCMLVACSTFCCRFDKLWSMECVWHRDGCTITCSKELQTCAWRCSRGF